MLKGDTVLRKMKSQYENEPDIFKASRMRSHLIGKLFASKENAVLWSVSLPAWVETLLSEVEFKQNEFA